ncbi:DUF5667 domain-containing protein [Streptomyces violaceochromogenes]|uniref:DUF5667 domain-containing protein n=1 Tax=Streptomyces violaceochromogenes TaxID=67377 RepID=A0ABU6M6R5_9ACTN|nr:DUF5667 domain-containing protein [Streptomyces violaceochromogenes]MEC7055824.1 DUF5667 domain-containing protein [Streptomyces violaceochromogenes]GHC70243.1 hypothetical protein GCM10010309_38200 [Streptomyces violaceochromogenes]
MIANVSAHRRANAFAQALEEQPEQGTAAEQPEGSAPAPAAAEPSEQDRHLALASGLGALPKPELDPEVKVVQRAQLVAAFEAMLQEGTAGGGATDSAVPGQRSRARGAHRASSLKKLRPRSRLAKGLTAGGLSVGVAASAFGGVSAASSDALPGDSLYGLKRGIEDVKLGLADGADERGRVYLDHASTRLSEARRLMERGRSGPLDHESLGEIRRALSGMRHDASEGHRLLSEAYERDPDSLGPMQALSTFSRSHHEAWGELRERLPVQLGDVSREVSSVFDAIEEDVAPLRSLLPEPPATSGGDGKRQGATESAPSGSSGTDRSARPSEGGSGHGEEGSTGNDGSPSRSAGSGSDSDGLLGGNTGGLLDPPKDSEASASPSTEGDTPVPEPDVTLPPLLPGLLPGLGIDSEDAD